MTASGDNPQINPERLPRHVAVIMDGNGRWAKKRFLPRVEGHRQGAKSVRMIVEECRALGIRYLTLFAFSTENWKRPEQEVGALMSLLVQYLESELELLLKNGVRLRAMGDLSKLPHKVRKLLTDNEESTKSLTGLDLILAISYGGREEILDASRALAKQCLNGKNPDEISESDLRASLYLPDVPDPDLLIRTSNETRISNFMLWQLAYSEIVVTSVLWPDFSKSTLHDCLKEFAGRNRRFGLTQEQIDRNQDSTEAQLHGTNGTR